MRHLLRATLTAALLASLAFAQVATPPAAATGSPVATILQSTVGMPTLGAKCASNNLAYFNYQTGATFGCVNGLIAVTNPSATWTRSYAAGGFNLTGLGNVTVGGTLGVTGATTLAAFSASGNATISSNARTGSASNKDLAGQLTLATGAATYTFAATYTSAPICVATEVTDATKTIGVTTSTTTLTLAGNSSDVINYVCVGRN